MDFRAGDVFTKSFEILLRNFVPLCLFCAAMSLPAFLYLYFFAPHELIDDADPSHHSLIALTIEAVSITLIDAVVAVGVIRELRGHRSDLAHGISVGLARFGVLVAVGIISTAIVLVGLMLFIVPGLMIAAAWFVIVPVVVLEPVPLAGTFSRSSELTRGYRWQIFGIILAIIACHIGIALVMGLLQMFFMPEFVESSLLGILIKSLMESPALAFGGVLGAVTYARLRAAKDGGDTEDVAAVFD